MNRKKIRVLVVDDSALFREIISRGINTDPRIEVIATATDPYDARDKILEYEPDVMTCDVEMPRMNGIEFIQKLMPQYPLPIIVVSSENGVVFDAIKAGAVDFVGKPNMKVLNAVEKFLEEMIDKIVIAASSKVRIFTEDKHTTSVLHRTMKYNRKLIALGASTGGVEAIYQILKELPSHIPGMVIVQHIPPNFSNMFAQRLHSTTNLNVKEAENDDYVEDGWVYIAPGNQHMKVKRIGERFRIECYEGDKVNGHCPSVDVLFESVAKEVGKDALGVILTGMGYDGAKGLLAMKRKGAKTIGQDEKTSVVYGMPKVAYNISAVDKQVPLHNIASSICDMLHY